MGLVEDNDLTRVCSGLGTCFARDISGWNMSLLLLLLLLLLL
jgi:hypothetical protein